MQKSIAYRPEKNKQKSASILRRIATQTGFSLSTITKVLRGDGDRYGIMAETQRTINAEAKRLGYISNFFARSLRRGHSGLVILLAYTSNYSVRVQRQNLVTQELRRQGVKVLTIDLSLPIGMNMKDTLSEVESFAPAGLLIAEVIDEETRRWINNLLRRGVPVVAMDHVEKLPVDQVYVNREMVGYLPARHLLELGHRQLLYVLPSSAASIIEDRRRGFQRALREAGVRFSSKNLCLFSRASSHCEAGYLASAPVKWRREGFTGVMTLSDQTALGVMRACYEQNVKIPEDLSLVGSEDWPPAACFPVPLTTVNWKLETLTSVAADWLVERLGGAGGAPRKKVIDPVLVPGRSSASPREVNR